MELFAGFSDDMIAVYGCIAAFLLCGSLMSLTHVVARRGRETSARVPALARQTVASKPRQRRAA